MKKLNFKAFTLVEVLIVIIIVGILIAALLPRLTGSQARARDLSRQLAVSQVASAIDLILSEKGQLSTTGVICFNGLDDIEASDGNVNIGSYLPLDKIPQDPSNDTVSAFGAGCAEKEVVVVVSNDGQKAIVAFMAETDVAANLAFTSATSFADEDALNTYFDELYDGGTAGAGMIAAETST